MSDKYQNEIISIIAHELRSPLTSVKGYLSAITDGIVHEKDQMQYISIALDETTRAIKLLENLMSLTKFDSAGIKLNTTAFDINGLILNIAKHNVNKAKLREITIKTDFESERLIVNADEDLICQVLTNLIENAVKYNVDSGNITLSSYKKNGKAYISVRDNGVGISGDLLPHIWERFYQVNPGNNKQYKGHGLGLAIVKEIISAHNEEISAESTLGEGSIFTFSLSTAF